MDITFVNKIIICYYKNKLQSEITLYYDISCTIKEIKEYLMKKVFVLVEYIDLRYRGASLEDDKTLKYYNIKDDCKMDVYLKVKIKKVGSKSEVLSVKYDQRIKDLMCKFCKIKNVSYLFLSCGQDCEENQSVRHYLTNPNCVFTAYEMVKVRVINKEGNFFFFEANDRDYMNTLKLRLRDKINYNDKDLLMIGKKALTDNSELYKYEKKDLYNICISFYIFVNYSNENIIKIRVTFNSIIWDIKKFLSKRKNIDLNKISLIYNNKQLENGQHIGIYGINENDTLNTLLKIKIIINYEGKDIITIVTKEKEKIINLKKKIFIKFGFNTDTIILLFNDKEINDEVELQNLKLQFQTRFYMKMKKNGFVYFKYRNMSGIESFNKNINLIIINTLKDSEEIHNFSISIDSNTVQHLRKIISQKFGISLCNVDIYYNEICLAEGLLQNYNLKDNSILYLKSYTNRKIKSEQFIINIVDQNGKIQKYMINESETIGGLKNTLRDQNDVKIERIKLKFEGKEMKDEESIVQMNIESETMLELFIEDDEKDAKEIIIKIRNRFYKEERAEECREIAFSDDSEVDLLKSRVDIEFGLSSKEYVISYGGDILKYENKINTYNIKDGEEVVISGSVLVRYFMTNDNASSKVYRYPIFPGDTVLDLHLKISKKTNLEPNFLRLSYNGCFLEVENKLCEMGVENGSYLILLSTLAGG